MKSFCVPFEPRRGEVSGETVARMLGALLPGGWRARVEDADAGACLHADRVILERRDVDRA